MNQTHLATENHDTISDQLARLSPQDEALLRLLMENPAQDEALVEALYRHLDTAAGARLLNVLKLDKLGFWLGSQAPARLQIRLMEAGRSSQHPAHQAFRTGLQKSGGLEKAYPAARI